MISIAIVIVIIIFIVLASIIIFMPFEWAQRSSYLFIGIAFLLTSYTIWRTYTKDNELLKEQQRVSRDNYYMSIYREFMTNPLLHDMYTDIYGDVPVHEHSMYQLMLESVENVADEYGYKNIPEHWIATWRKWFSTPSFHHYFDSIQDEFRPQLVSIIKSIK